MWKSPVIVVVDISEYILLAASVSGQVACDRLRCC